MATLHAALYPTWPSAGSVAFLNQVVSLVNTRLQGCPLSYDTAYYIRHDPVNGDSSGGGYAGTEADPFRVADGDELVTLIHSLKGAGSVVFYLRGGDTFIGTSQIDLDQDNLCLRSYGTGRAVITTFEADNVLPSTGSWTLAANGRYTKTFTGTPNLTWLRFNESFSTLQAGTETVFTKCNSTAEVEASTYGFYFAVAGTDTTVHVRANGDAIDDGDFLLCRNTSSIGCYVTADKCRVHQILFAGFAIQQSNNGLMNLVAGISGTQEVVFTECGSYYSGGAHLIAQISNVAGGLITTKDCDMGLMRAPSDDSNAVALVYYNVDGDNEGIAVDNEYVYGTLPDYGLRARRGVPFYSHTSGSSERCSLMLAWGQVSRNHTYGMLMNGKWGACPLLAGGSHWDTTDYRAWNIGEVFEGGAGTALDLNVSECLLINCNYKVRRLSSTTALTGFCDPVFKRKNLKINCAVQIDLQDAPNDAVQASRMFATTTYTITAITASLTAPQITTSGAHGLSVGDYVHFYSTNSTPVIDGVYKVQTVPTSTTFTISAATTVAGTSGTMVYAEMTGEIHCHYEVDDAGSANFHNFAWEVCNGPAMKSWNARVFNSILAIKADTSGVRQQWCRNQAPATSLTDIDTGGGSHNAYWSATTIQKANSGSGSTARYGYDGTTNYRDNTTSPALAAMPTFLANPATGLSGQATTALPFAVEYDINFRQRSVTPSIGPVDDPAEGLVAIDAFEDWTPSVSTFNRLVSTNEPPMRQRMGGLRLWRIHMPVSAE
jgi:hypothetical protein